MSFNSAVISTILPPVWCWNEGTEDDLKIKHEEHSSTTECAGNKWIDEWDRGGSWLADL